jgi:Flp pilus assembly pilin Flp
VRSRWREVLRQFGTGESGQDMVEYALLTAFIGLAGAAAFSLLAGAIGLAYGSWDSGSQGLWVPPDPE